MQMDGGDAMDVDRTSRKVLVIESDDWGICSWCPDPQSEAEGSGFLSKISAADTTSTQRAQLRR